MKILFIITAASDEFRNWLLPDKSLQRCRYINMLDCQSESLGLCNPSIIWNFKEENTTFRKLDLFHSQVTGKGDVYSVGSFRNS
jgi:hypothetical protein